MEAARGATAGLAVACLLAACTLTACAPGTPDEDSWRGDAERAVGTVDSSVQTARLVLAQAVAGRVPYRYLRTVLLDAETSAGKAAQKLSAVQPPDVEVRRSSEVNARLQEATTLLTDARIAVVAHDESGYQHVTESLGRADDHLAALEAALLQPPREAD